jgi:hypothetical protein
MVNWLLTKSNRKMSLNIRIHWDITGGMWLVVGVKILDSKFKGGTNNGGRS